MRADGGERRVGVAPQLDQLDDGAAEEAEPREEARGSASSAAPSSS